jgi:glycosyltransferase involved in cell wall biosynthesis
MNDVAIVFESFVRAGSQRHLVEIIKGIRLFHPELRCTLFLISPADHRWSSFLPEVHEAGCPVVHAPYRYDRREGQGLIARAHNWLSRQWRERNLNVDFYYELYNYSSIVCAEFFVADLLLPHIRPRQRLCFHLMEHVAQRTNTSHYRLLHHKRLNLIYMHDSQIVQLPDPPAHSSCITWPVRLCPDHLKKRPQKASEATGPLRVAHYSRISPMRFIDQVIDAFALLAQHTPATLRIAGFVEDPNYLQQLKKQIHDLGLLNVVSFVDPVPSPAEDPSGNNVDLVWMISLSGHIGYAGLEAMAAGFPTLLLEVDSDPRSYPSDSELESLICSSPGEIVERSLLVNSDPQLFLRQQTQLLRTRFITSNQAIQDLVAFYQGNQ